MSKLNIQMDVQIYISRYGVVSDAHPYGDRVWHGLREDLKDWLFGPCGGWRGGPAWAFGNLVPGWFTAPSSFSKANARQPLEDIPGFRYPAVFARSEQHASGTTTIYAEEYYMWCQHILIQKSRYWVVHHTRVHLLSDFQAFFRQLE